MTQRWPQKAPPDSQESLARHMEWLYGKDGVYGGDGTQRCLCEHAYENMGRLEGITMGKGWVRTSTHPDCPFHAGR